MARAQELIVRQHEISQSRQGGTVAVRNGRKPEYLQDKDIQQNIKQLKESRDELEHINDFLKNVLEYPSEEEGWLRKRVMSAFHAVLPRRVYDFVPSSMMPFLAEEYDLLEYIERLMRGNVDNVQEALRRIASSAAEKLLNIDQLREDLGRARDEEWDAKTLQQYMADRAGVPVYEEVARLLDHEFNVLSPEEKERRKVELLQQLEDNAAIGEELMDTMSKVCVAGLQVFSQGVAQYFNYMNVYRPLAVIRDAAKAMTEMNESNYAAREALRNTFLASVRAIEASVDAANLVSQYSIASPDMKGLLQEGKRDIEKKLAALQPQLETRAALEQKTRKGTSQGSVRVALKIS